MASSACRGRQCGQFRLLSDAQRIWLTEAIHNVIPSMAALQRNTEELGSLCRRGKAETIQASSTKSSSLVTDLRRSISGFAVTHRLLGTSTRSTLSRLGSWLIRMSFRTVLG